MWDPPGPGFEPVSPALAGRFPTTVPPGKSLSGFNIQKIRVPEGEEKENGVEKIEI